MKKLLFTLTLAAALTVGSQTTFAQAKKKAAPAPAPAPAAAAEKPKSDRHLPMHTIVASVDASAKSFTHKNTTGKVVTYVTTATTEFKNEGKDASFSDIKVGDEVNGTRIKKSDTEYEVVKTTYIGAPKPKAGKPAPEPKKTK